jgi:nucleoid-associated protein YgaU
MGLLDKIFDGDDKTPKRNESVKKPAGDAAPRFDDVRGSSSTTAPSGGAAAASRTSRSYTVVAGDSLSKIAKREYGDASKWPSIFEANRDKIQNPDLIHPGQVLTLPPNP